MIHDSDEYDYTNEGEDVGRDFRFLLDLVDRLREENERLREKRDRKLFWRRCGWCGAYEGTVDPNEPCPAAIDHDAETGEPYICGPHQFGPLEDASAVLQLLLGEEG